VLSVPGAGFTHSAYARIEPGNDLLALFIEGDGRPWVDGGRSVASDPTPRAPIALQLALETPGSVLYLGRPCYFAARSDPACQMRWWTSGRYADVIVTSMAAAAKRFINEHSVQRVLLVGYSGGGTLAVLLAEQLPQVVGLVSIAGNLDPDAWTQQHHYLPLTTSINPALQAPLTPALPQWYLIGGRDVNVTDGMASRYLRRVPPASIWRFEDFDHACCWARAWPEVYAHIAGQLAR
jgi:pimeloyl-ACP methyl ester carboxylesterase